MFRKFSILFYTLILILTQGILSPAASAAAGRTSSFIKEVTVFSDRALVVRQAKITLVPGERTIRFHRMTGSMDPNSVQIKGYGPAMIKGVKVEPVYMEAGQDADLNLLTEKLETIQNRITMVKDQISHAKQEKKFIEAIAKRLTTATEKSEQAELDPKKWIDMVSFYRNKLDKLDKEMRINTAALKPLRDKKNKLEREISDLHSRIQYTKYDISVIVTATAEGQATLDLSYIVMGPNWQPRYDVRADSKKAAVQVAYHASIRQNTGEDWRRARLLLSTAKPQAGDKHPELAAWRVRPYTPPPPRRSSTKKKRSFSKMKSMAAPVMKFSDAESALGNAAPQPEAISYIEAEAKTGGTAVYFDIKGKHTIKSDNQPHQVTIMVKDYPATFKYSAVPKLVKQAYLKAEITNDTDFPLLAGETNIFLDNNFVTSGSINTISPSETFWTFLGIDEGIKVEYKLINREQSKPGMFGNKIKVTFDYLIKVTNHKKQSHDLVLQDQLPLPAHRDIQVELISPVYKQNDKTFTKNNENLLEWKKTLKPGEIIEIPLKFTVTHPENMRVEGL